MNSKSAISAINEHGLLLVFPMNNSIEPKSLWSHFYPRSRMCWEWDDSGDDRVARLWRLREELSRSRKVVYTKWYRGRATFFSFQVFSALLKTLNDQVHIRAGLTPIAQEVLSLLEESSPISTKSLKEAANLKGRSNEGTYQRTLKSLFDRGLAVAYGEVDDGAFPSLAVASTHGIFEDLWKESFALTPAQCEKILSPCFKDGSKAQRYLEALKKKLATPRKFKSIPSVVEYSNF